MVGCKCFGGFCPLCHFTLKMEAMMPGRDEEGIQNFGRKTRK